MKLKKTTVGIICGGRSLEHSFSIVSAKNIYIHLHNHYNIIILCIDDTGHWHYGKVKNILHGDSLLEATFDWNKTPIVHICKNGKLLTNDGDGKTDAVDSVDVVFPITNGIDGHQGAIPGMMKLLDIPCVGSDVFETVVCIDKEITKSLLENNTLPVVPYLVGRSLEDHSFEKVSNQLGLPFFVKPCRMSSSAGVNKVNNELEYKKAVAQALELDDKFLLEIAIFGRELESAIIGNSTPIVSEILGEVICDDFYSYDTKYQSTSTSKAILPAPLESHIKDQIISYSQKAYKVLGCKGYARIDFFLDKENKIYINEATTLPLFTGISMFPKLWEDKIEETICSLVEMSFEK